MDSLARVTRIGSAIVVLGLVLANAPSAVALDASIGLAVTVEPAAPFFADPVDVTIVVEAEGDAVSDVTVRVEHDCSEVSERVELSGNGDELLELGEQWQYGCHSDLVFHGVVGVTVTGTDLSGDPVESSALFDYGAPFPFDIDITAPTTEADEGSEVTWEVLVGNLGSRAIVDVDGQARLNDTGAYSPMTGPVEVDGNGDDLLDPGEVWAYEYTTELWQESFLSVWLSGAPEVSPLTGFVSNTDSDPVSVTPAPPSPLPATGLEVAPVVFAGLSSLAAGWALLRVSETRTRAKRRPGRDR